LSRVRAVGAYCPTERRLVMQRFRSKAALTVAGVVLLALTLGVGIGYAASTVVRDTTSVRLRVIQSEFANGFDSGWHMHPGVVIVQVQEGSFRIYQGGCRATVVHSGETYLEVPFVPVRAVAKGNIKWTTSQILPSTDPPMTNVPNPCTGGDNGNPGD
jgi:quercetin dioxygenase-like cupin family protein